jgi:hypothetical protein
VVRQTRLCTWKNKETGRFLELLRLALGTPGAVCIALMRPVPVYVDGMIRGQMSMAATPSP